MFLRVHLDTGGAMSDLGLLKERTKIQEALY